MKRPKSPFAPRLLLAILAVLVAVGGSAALVNGHRLFGQAPAAVKDAATSATATTARTLQATRASRGPAASPTATTPPPGAPTHAAGSDGSGQLATGLHVNNVSVSVDQASFSGVCPNQVPFVFTLTISIDTHLGDGLVDYNWLNSDGLQWSDEYLYFGPADTTKTVTRTFTQPAWNGDGSTRWIGAQVWQGSSPVAARAQYSLRCMRAITGMTATVSPTEWSGVCTGLAYFSLEVVVDISLSPDTAPNTLAWTSTTDLPNVAIVSTPTPGGGRPPATWSPYPSSGNMWVVSATGDPNNSYTRGVYQYGGYHLDTTAPNGTYVISFTATGLDNQPITRTVTVTKNCS